MLTNRVARLQKMERWRKDLTSYGKRLSVEAKMIRELLKKQPQKKNDLCRRAGISISSFHRILPLLKEAEIIKETEGGFALWTYIESEKDVEDVLDKSEETDSFPITFNKIASEIGVSPSEIEKVIYPIVKKRGMEVRVIEGEKAVDRRESGGVLIV